jgi:four helix bundle protein
MKDFRQLKVWEKAHRLTLDVDKATMVFPKDELYGLTSQLRRSSSSIAANIAEGCGRKGDAEFTRFLQIGMGSASETEYHLLLARDLGFLSDEEHQSLNSKVVETKRMLATLLKTLRADRLKPAANRQ